MLVVTQSGHTTDRSQVGTSSRLDPEAVAYEFYGWLVALYSWVAGLAEQATAYYITLHYIRNILSALS